MERVSLRPKGVSYMLVGRAADACDIACGHPSVSRFHAVLQFGNMQELDSESTSLFLYDLKSTHGTRINKRKVPPHQYVALRDGDHVVFGESTRSYVLTFANQEREQAPNSRQDTDDDANANALDQSTRREKTSKRAANNAARLEARHLKLVANQEKRERLLKDIQAIEVKQNTQELSENQRRQVEALIRKVEALDEAIAKEHAALEEAAGDQAEVSPTRKLATEDISLDDVTDATRTARPGTRESEPRSTERQKLAKLSSLYQELDKKVSLAQQELTKVKTTIRSHEAGSDAHEEDSLDGYMSANWRTLLDSELKTVQRRFNDACRQRDEVHGLIQLHKNADELLAALPEGLVPIAAPADMAPPPPKRVRKF